jgi:hypothetical protein
MSAATPIRGRPVSPAADDAAMTFDLAMDEAHAIADLIFEATHDQRMAGEIAGNMWAKTLNVAAFAITRRIDEARAAANREKS